MHEEGRPVCVRVVSLSEALSHHGRPGRVVRVFYCPHVARARTPLLHKAMAALGSILRSIRSADESAEFDLAGSVAETAARELMRGAFETPLPIAKPIKLSFIIGGGRATRSRYDEKLPQWLMGELRAMGYSDDRGASLGCQKAFKKQVRDTLSA